MQVDRLAVGEPCAPSVSTRSRTKRRKSSSRRETRRGVNAEPIKPRSRVCTGGSSITIVGARPSSAGSLRKVMPCAEEKLGGVAHRVPDVGEAGQDVEVAITVPAGVAVHRIVVAQLPVGGIGVVELGRVVRVVGRRRHAASPFSDHNDGR